MSKKNKTAILFKHSLIVVFVILVSLLISSCNKDTTKIRDIDTALSRDVLHQNFTNVTIKYQDNTVDRNREATIYVNNDDYITVLDGSDNPLYTQAVGYYQCYIYTNVNGVWYKELDYVSMFESRVDFMILSLVKSGDFNYDEKTDRYVLSQEALDEIFFYLQWIYVGSGSSVHSLSIGLDGTYITTMELFYDDDDGNPANYHFEYYDYNQTIVELPAARDVDELLETVMSFGYKNLSLDISLTLMNSQTTSSMQIEYDNGTYQTLVNQTTKYFVQDTASDSYKVIYQDQDNNWVEGDTDSDAAEVFGYIKLISIFEEKMFYFSDVVGGFALYASYKTEVLECLKNENIVSLISLELIIVDDKISLIQINGLAKGGSTYVIEIQLSDYNEISISLPIV